MRRAGSILLRWLLVAVALAILAGGAWLGYVAWASASVTVTEVVTGPVVQAFYATGTLQPDREYPIKSNVEGNVTEVYVDKGQNVTKGQKLAFVRVDEYLMRHSQAVADLELKKKLVNLERSPILAEFAAKARAAQEQFDIAMRELSRQQKLRERDATAQVELDKALEQVALMRTLVDATEANRKAKVFELERDVTVAQAALDIAQWNIDQQTITSPIDGRVLDWPVTIGSRVPVNGPLMKVANVAPDKLVMRASVDEEDKTRVVVGQQVKVSLYAYEGKIFAGHVTKIYPQADPDRRTFEVDMAIKPPDPNFSAGMTGELAFIVDQKPVAVVIPSQAVQAGKVWKLVGNQVEPVEVSVGLKSIERVEILTGLQPGDSVVISPATNLKPHQHVRTKRIDPVTAAGLNKPPAETKVQGGIEKL
jgi:multidrug efflux pump subunit AcrA (membrane-fusion protein)